MRIVKVEQKTPEWIEVRRGKVTGTQLKRIAGGAKAAETAYYEILAEKLTVSDGYDNEAAMDRGVRLESEAISEFEKRSGKKVEIVGFVISDWSNEVGYSPDGLIKVGKKYREDIEVKCLSSGNHVRAWLTGLVPDDYMDQVVHGFIVNDELQTRYVVFYDPRISVKPYHVIKVERSGVEQQIAAKTEAIKKFLARMDGQMSKIVKL